jgi:hypothetical protein
MRWTKLDFTCVCFFNKLNHHCFKSSPSIYTNWIDRVIFFIFHPSKIFISPTNIVSSLSPHRCHLSTSQRRHIATSCHASFSLSQDDLIVFVLFSSNVLSRRLPSRALNLHHHHMLPSLDRLTFTLNCFKKIILTLANLLTTQPHLYFYLLNSQTTTSLELQPPPPFPFPDV